MEKLLILLSTQLFWQNSWFYVSLLILLGAFAAILIIINLNMKSKEKQDIIIDEKTSQIQTLNSEINEMKNEKSGFDKKINSLQENLSNITKENENCKQQLKSDKESLKKLQQSIDDQKNKQELLIEERTNDLILAKEKAEEADKLKSAFLSNLSHEIRTPMNGIIGFTQLLATPGLTDERKSEYIKMIVESGKSLLFLIDDIIDISKIDTEQLVIKKSNCFINKMLKDLFASYKNYIKQKGRSNLELKLTLGISDDYYSIHTDVVRIKQAISNLINNAVKFTDQGFIEFGYELDKESKPLTLKFFVKDSGIGLPKDKQEAIFERFSKIHGDKNKIYRGAGLGLTITKNLIKLL